MTGQGQVVRVDARDDGGHVVIATTTSHRLATIVLVDGVLGTEVGDELIARAADIYQRIQESPKPRRRRRDGTG